MKEIEQQEKNKKLVDLHVYVCVSSEAEYILRSTGDFQDKPFNYEDITNMKEDTEIFEYWKVSSWLIEKLEEKGECVIKHANIWCRQTSGQAILLDSVITDIQRGLK